ncbi:hypothetical protein CTAM01_17051 [Colletotrichum tamarilloi]|uniref:Uncharacterized protein n=1 Tax=Colletotrichum tamarilloi TaxID=1209934 RepID=A0ABQ9QGY6_9PEZI|nr:uncharacterized protein CTAM01_17051 [Colletotrichum tamarilloi]KAK1465539.1 hypothetical protein CTAM01_17051 [Colletotrichum tamarilloi]
MLRLRRGPTRRAVKPILGFRSCSLASLILSLLLERQLKTSGPRLEYLVLRLGKRRTLSLSSSFYQRP